MNKKEIKELVKLCDYPALQCLWKPKEGDEHYWKSAKRVLFVTDEYSKDSKKSYRKLSVWLPGVEDCIRLMGNKFERLTTFSTGFECGYYDGTVFTYEEDVSPRLACLKTLKLLLKGD